MIGELNWQGGVSVRRRLRVDAPAEGVLSSHQSPITSHRLHFPALSALSAFRRRTKILSAVRLEITVAQAVEGSPCQDELLGQRRQNWSRLLLICLSLRYPVEALALLLVVFQGTPG